MDRRELFARLDAMTEAILPRAGAPARSATPGRYALASVGLMAIATANGVTRELTYAKHLNDATAHRLSLIPMVVLFGLYVDQLERRWPLPTWRGAVGAGAMWAAIAVGMPRRRLRENLSVAVDTPENPREIGKFPAFPAVITGTTMMAPTKRSQLLSRTYAKQTAVP
jgi:hypothetical protein